MGITLLSSSSSLACACRIWGTSLAVLSAQGFFYSILNMEHRAQGSTKAPLWKSYFQVSQIIGSLYGTLWLSSKSKKGHMGNILSASLKGPYPFPLRGTYLPSHQECFVKHVASHTARRRGTGWLPIWGIRVCRRNHPVHDTFSRGPIQEILSPCITFLSYSS